jgi:hypothetical protein
MYGQQQLLFTSVKLKKKSSVREIGCNSISKIDGMTLDQK